VFTAYSDESGSPDQAAVVVAGSRACQPKSARVEGGGHCYAIKYILEPEVPLSLLSNLVD